MRLRRKGDGGVFEADLTPMIDMTFQLIAFFMVIINFAQTEQNDKVKLPDSSLVKAPDKPFEHQVIVHLAQDGRAIVSGQMMFIDGMGIILGREARALEITQNRVSDATIVVRAHKWARAGDVQRLIKKCQEYGFEKFALRAEGRQGLPKYISGR